MDLVEFGGQKLWTESLGPPSGPPLLLIGGAGAHAHFWTDSFCHPFVEEGFFIIRYDHRDVGLSHPSQEGYNLLRLAQDATEILNAYNLPAAHIVGHSMGGYIAQLLGAEFPDRVLTLTLIAAGPVGEPPGGMPPPSEHEKTLLQTTWREMISNRPTQDFEQSLEGYMRVWRRLNGLYPVDEGLARRYTEELYTRSRYPVGVHDRHVKVMQEVAETFKERGAIFARIQTPTLIIQGEEDYLVSPARGGNLLAKAMPTARYQRIPKMGHMLFNHEIEKKVAATILAFIKENG